jgi:hypothetical protein
MYATYDAPACGCKVTGNGSLQHPLAVKLCAIHSSAPALLKALRQISKEANFQAGCSSQTLGDIAIECERIARAALANGKLGGRPNLHNTPEARPEGWAAAWESRMVRDGRTVSHGHKAACPAGYFAGRLESIRLEDGTWTWAEDRA